MARRYDDMAIALHWAIAFLIPAAFFLAEAETASDPRSATYVLHAVAGFAVLALTGVRIAWRLFASVPPYPAAMPTWQRGAAKAVALGFYVLMILMPLTGWIAHSGAFSGPFAGGPKLDVFGLATVPAFPGWRLFPIGLLRELHAVGSHLWIPLLVLHVAAALKHQFIDGNDVLARMLPVRRRVTSS